MYQISFIIPYLYEAQHVSGDTPPIIRTLKLHWQPLVFHTWKVVGRVVGGRCQAKYVPDNVHKPHVQTTFHLRKTRGCQCSFRLLIMGGVSPETYWASYKYGILKKFWYIVASCWIFLYELYYAARIHERQPKKETEWICQRCTFFFGTLKIMRMVGISRNLSSPQRFKFFC